MNQQAAKNKKRLGELYHQLGDIAAPPELPRVTSVASNRRSGRRSHKPKRVKLEVSVTPAQRRAILAILTEREYQDRKWGQIDTYDHEVDDWIAIAREELSEASSDYNTNGSDSNFRSETVQAAAVLLAMLEVYGSETREQAAKRLAKLKIRERLDANLHNQRQDQRQDQQHESSSLSQNVAKFREESLYRKRS